MTTAMTPAIASSVFQSGRALEDRAGRGRRDSSDESGDDAEGGGASAGDDAGIAESRPSETLFRDSGGAVEVLPVAFLDSREKEDPAGCASSRTGEAVIGG